MKLPVAPGGKKKIPTPVKHTPVWSCVGPLEPLSPQHLPLGQGAAPLGATRCSTGRGSHPKAAVGSLRPPPSPSLRGHGGSARHRMRPSAMGSCLPGVRDATAPGTCVARGAGDSQGDACSGHATGWAAFRATRGTLTSKSGHCRS